MYKIGDYELNVTRKHLVRLLNGRAYLIERDENGEAGFACNTDRPEELLELFIKITPFQGARLCCPLFTLAVLHESEGKESSVKTNLYFVNQTAINFIRAMVKDLANEWS